MHMKWLSLSLYPLGEVNGLLTGGSFLWQQEVLASPGVAGEDVGLPNVPSLSLSLQWWP